MKTHHLKLPKIFVLLIFVLLTVFSKSQNKKFEIGIEASPTLTFLRGSDFLRELHRPTIGYAGGIYAQQNFTEIFSFHIGLDYEKKGSVSDIVLTDQVGNRVGTVQASLAFHYLVCPLMIRATFGKDFQYFVNAGPYFGYLIKQTFNADKIFGLTEPIDNTENNKREDMGVSFGFGIRVPLGERFSLSGELRNNLGLYNVSALPVMDDGKILMNSTNVMLAVGYAF